MIGETNINGGAGLNGKGALLKIKSQTGSTITVSKGSYSKIINTNLLIDDIFSYWFFQTNDYGEWTITSTDYNDTTVTDTITITNTGEYEIELIHKLYLYKAGNQCTDITGGWGGAGSWTYTASGATCRNATYNTTNVYLGGSDIVTAMPTLNKVSLTGWKQICFEGKVIQTYSTYVAASMGIYANKGYMYNKIASIWAGPELGNFIVSINLIDNAITDPVYIGCFTAGGVSDYRYYIYNIWLE